MRELLNVIGVGLRGFFYEVVWANWLIGCAERHRAAEQRHANRRRYLADRAVRVAQSGMSDAEIKRILRTRSDRVDEAIRVQIAGVFADDHTIADAARAAIDQQMRKLEEGD